MADAILVMTKINQEFPGVKALQEVDFELFPGEVHALMGENGAGKSTLMKILSGVYQHTGGQIFLHGKEIRFRSPSDAQEAGISIIHQEFNLFPNLSAAENIFIDRKDMTKKFGIVNWSKVYKQAEEIIRSLGSDIDVKKEVRLLGVHSQQVIEIAKALSFNAEILIMDEPSAALPENEVQNMFEIVRQLKKRGVAIVYVSHRMKEVFEIADKVTVLRDGKKVATKSIQDTSEKEIISMMIGKDAGNLYPDKKNAVAGKPVLSVKNLELAPGSKVSFELRKGEVLGLFGLVGSGTYTLAERLFGLTSGPGDIQLNGKNILIGSPKEAMRHKIALVPSDRHRQGLVKELSVLQNVTMPVLKGISRYLWIQRAVENDLCQEYIDRLRIKTPHSDQRVELLSGGNQQKILLARWLATDPEMLILVEPTRGVDVGAKAEIYQFINRLTEEGLSILLVSSDMPEVLGISGRILVMHKGRIVNEFQRGAVDQQVLLKEASDPSRMVV